MTIPTTVQVRDQIIGYVEARLNQKIPLISRAYVRVVASAVAGVIVLSYRFVDWCLKQTQPATCNEFFLGLFSTRYGVTRGAAVAAQLRLDATGTEGSDIDAKTLWVTPDGVVYQQQALVTIVSGVASPVVTCLTLGASGNLADGAALSLVSPVAGIDADAVVDTSGTVIEGVDRESVAQWRAEVMNRIRYRPQGGAIPDYVIWALEVPGIVKAFVKSPAPGDVNVYPLIDVTGTARVPGAPKIAEVEAYLTDPVRKPLGANVYTLAATERTCATTITGATINGSPLSASQKQAVQDAVDAALYAAYPRQYPDQPAPTDTVSTAVAWGSLYSIGATATAVTISISGIGGGPYVLPIGEIIKPSGAITWA